MNIDAWFTVEEFGYKRPGFGPEVQTLDDAKEAVAKQYPHMVELPVNGSPLIANFIFDERKKPWTSFFSREEKIAIFAFSDVKDAVEFRLKV